MVPRRLGAAPISSSFEVARPREKVWRAVTEPEHLAAWYPQEIVGERRAGAPLRFVSSAGDGFDVRPSRAHVLETLLSPIDEVADVAKDGLDRIGSDASLCFAFLRHSGLRL